ncbi:hypothetical protein FQZ97_1144840 [compost metagenome]
MALAPSQVWLETAAVTLSQPNSGSSSAIFSRLVRRGVSSWTTPASGTISRAKRPSSMARRARTCDSSA